MLTPMLKANAIIGPYLKLCHATQSVKYQPSSLGASHCVLRLKVLIVDRDIHPIHWCVGKNSR
jgi:hypothetical protein